MNFLPNFGSLVSNPPKKPNSLEEERAMLAANALTQMGESPGLSDIFCNTVENALELAGRYPGKYTGKEVIEFVWHSLKYEYSKYPHRFGRVGVEIVQAERAPNSDHMLINAHVVVQGTVSFLTFPIPGMEWAAIVKSRE